MELAITDTGRPVELHEPELPPARPHMPKKCDNCRQPFKDDIFCAWHGPVAERWMCDDCVTSFRRGAAGPVTNILYKPAMSANVIREQIDVVEHAIKNLAEIKWIEGSDAAGSARSVNLNLSPKESRPIYLALRDVLRHKLEADASFPA